MLGLIVLLTFAAVGLTALVVLSVIRRALRQYEERYLSRGSEALGEMFYFVEGRQLLLLTLGITIAFGILGFVLFNWLVGLLMAITGFVAPFYGIRIIRQRRVRNFETQLVDALVQMSASIRAGQSFAQATETIAEEMPPPLSQEFGLLVKELKLGVQVDEALQNMADRVESQDLQLVVTAIIIARQLGGNMAEIFDTISETIRERFKMEGRIRALTAQGKLQGWIVGAMPLVLALVLNYMRPDLMQPMLHSTFGLLLFSLVGVMEVAGIWLIRRIVTVDV
ncbi:MAG: type II secretion system F family protein [Deltaproteobacteria bacterium]|nr:type II secretion system F family protein [Deltaproteobacteria bacterium]